MFLTFYYKDWQNIGIDNWGNKNFFRWFIPYFQFASNVKELNECSYNLFVTHRKHPS